MKIFAFRQTAQQDATMGRHSSSQRDRRVLLQVINAECFGNHIQKLREEECRRMGGAAPERPFSLETSGRRISRLLRIYGDGEGKEPFALFNSNGSLELAVRNGSASAMLAGSACTPAHLRP